MKIAVIGAGKVGQALGRAWSARGHAVTYGVRDPAAPDYAELKHGAVIAPVRSAVDQAEAIFLAVPWDAAPDVVRDLGNLEGKVLIDATNAVRFGGPVVERTLASDGSGAELLQALAPSADVVKAFNQYGFEVLGQAASFEHPPLLLMAGNAEAAKATVAQLAVDAGFEPIDVGPLLAARLIEDTARLWMTLIRHPALGRRFSYVVQRLA